MTAIVGGLLDTEPPIPTLVRLHGGLMVVAYFAMMIGAAASARYKEIVFFKSLMQNKGNWFQLHRAIQVRDRLYVGRPMGQMPVLL